METCAIVGGGLLGLLCARACALQGFRVLLLEKGKVGREASWAGGGILSPLYPWRYPKAVNALVAWSQRCYPELALALYRSTGVDPQWTRNGLLILSQDDEALRWSAEEGCPVEPIDRVALRRLEPALALQRDALWMPEVAQVRNPRLLKSLRLALLRERVDIREHTQVTGFILDKGRVVGVETTRGKVMAEKVVVAAGAWSGQLLASVGLRLPIEPVKGQMIMFRAEPGVVTRIVLHGDRYAIPRRDGRVVVGSTVERAGFDKGVTEKAGKALVEEAMALFPMLRRYPIERQWAGLRPGILLEARKGIPFIGEHPAIEGLYVIAGHFRNGVVMAPASVRLLLDQMLNRSPIVDATPYAPTLEIV